MNNVTKILGIAVVTASLAACGTGRDKELGGTLLGAAAGGAIGSQIGSGAGNAIAIGTGVLIGGLIGNQIGRYMDEQDRELAARNAQYSLDNSRSGVSSGWNNPDNGHRGTFTPEPAYRDNHGTWCRQGTHSVWIDGREEVVTETYCRDSEGVWRGQA